MTPWPEHDVVATANRLLATWAGFVKGLDEPCAWSGPEFTHEMGCRHELARLWPLLPAAARDERRPLLDLVDERFRAVTVPWPGKDTEADPWWSERIPRVLEAADGDTDERGWPRGWPVPHPVPDGVRVVGG
jgi:hypothetical protein